MSEANTNPINVDEMKFIPVYTQESAHYFNTDLPIEKVVQGSVPLETGYLKPGMLFSMLGIGQTKSLLECGIQDVTDGIDPDMSLAEIAIAFKHNGEDHVWYHKLEMPEGVDPLGAFTSSPQGNYRTIQLNYAGVITMTSKANVTNTVGVSGFGTCNLELGNTEVDFKLTVQEDADFTDVRVVGYKLNAKRVNYNRQPA